MNQTRGEIMSKDNIKVVLSRNWSSFYSNEQSVNCDAREMDGELELIRIISHIQEESHRLYD